MLASMQVNRVVYIGARHHPAAITDVFCRVLCRNISRRRAVLLHANPRQKLRVIAEDSRLFGSRLFMEGTTGLSGLTPLLTSVLVLRHLYQLGGAGTGFRDVPGLWIDRHHDDAERRSEWSGGKLLPIVVATDLKLHKEASGATAKSVELACELDRHGVHIGGSSSAGLPPSNVSSPRDFWSTTSVVYFSVPPWSVHFLVWSAPSR